MKLLLDTRLLLWWLDDNQALSPAARELIADENNAVFVSAVSLWEIWLKVSLGKLRVSPDFDEVLAAQQFEALPLTAAHARELATLPWLHRDPFDRMLVAQAIASGITLITADTTIGAYGSCVKVV